MGNEALFSSQAGTYAKHRPTYPQELFDFILQHVTTFDIAWDAATGNGQAAVALSSHFKKVMATDISSQQLSFAVTRKNIEYIRCPSEKTPFPDNQINLITVAQAYHWFDFEQFRIEVNRVAAPECILAIWAYEHLNINDRIDSLVLHFHDHVVGPWWDPRRKYITDGIKTAPFDYEEIPAPGFKIKLEWSKDHLRGYLESWSSVQAFQREKGFNPVNDFMNELNAIWPEPSARFVYFPVFLRLARINK